LKYKPFTCIFERRSPWKHLVQSAAKCPQVISVWMWSKEQKGYPPYTRNYIKEKDLEISSNMKKHCQKPKTYSNYNINMDWFMGVTYPKVAGEELRTSGGTYAAVPTNVQALSSEQRIKRKKLTCILKKT